MARRHRILVTRPERLHWLEQLDSGVGITKIAHTSGRDIRIVKRHIEIAREETQLANVKKEYLLERLRQHQDDLLVEVGSIRDAVTKYTSTALKPVEPLRGKIYDGLMEHLKVQPAGKLIGTWKKVAAENEVDFNRIRGEINIRERDILSHLPEPINTYPWSASILTELEAGSFKNPPSETDYTKTRLGGDKIEVRYQSQNLTRSPLPENQVEFIVKAHLALRSFSSGYQLEITKLHEHLKNIASALVDELDAFSIRRLIPGHCRYCPIK